MLELIKTVKVDLDPFNFMEASLFMSWGSGRTKSDSLQRGVNHFGLVKRGWGQHFFGLYIFSMFYGVLGANSEGGELFWTII